MTIRSQKMYDQHAHDQPTQATPWASEHGGDTARTERSLRGMFGNATYESIAAGMGADTRKLVPSRGPGSDTTVDRRKSGPPGGGALRPERLTGDQMEAMSPGWTAESLRRGHRSDGGNG